jgi:hypothetical protein
LRFTRQPTSRFFVRIARDTRGEDLTEKSSGLSNAGKVVMAAVAIAVAAAGATTLANNSSQAGDHTSQNINSAVGAQADTTQKATAPFQVK